MATRTISNSGGLWSSTGTWVEGAVPTTADAVVATATSGNVTINTTTCVCSTMILTNYVGLMTFTAEQKLTVTTTVTFVTGMTLAGTGKLQLSDTATITSAGLTFPGSITFDAGTWTLADNWTVTGSLVALGANSLNGYSVYVGGSYQTSSGSNLTGTTQIILNGTGTLSTGTSGGFGLGVTINTSGTITISGNVTFIGSSTIVYVAGTVVTTSSVLILDDPAFTLNTAGMVWNNIRLAASLTLTLASGLSCGMLSNTANSAITFAGAYNINCTGFRFSIATIARSFAFVSGITLTISNSMCIISAQTNGVDVFITISSITASSPFYLNYTGTSANCKLFGVIFTDVDASGSAQGLDNWYGGTLTRCTNITNRTSADIGGGTVNDVFGIIG